MREALRRGTLALLAALVLATPAQAAGLTPAMEKQLGETKYVYIQSQRKDGNFGQPAEIWFFLHDGAVYVGSKKTSWRARRILKGHTAAKVHAFAPSGPSFDAVGQIVSDQGAWKLLFEAFAKKYPEGWPTYEKDFRLGATDGSRVLIKYTPK